MQTRRFGASLAHALGDVPVIGIGTWNVERDDPTQVVASLRRAIELGMVHIDTAEMYGRGRAEELVAQAIAGQRDRVFLVSKVLPNNARHDAVLASCEASLRRLGTDRLDVYLLHWRGNTPLAETISAFETLVKQGKIRAWGVSNFDDADLAETLAIAGPGKIACNQVLYHLRERAIEHRVIPWCQQHGVEVVAYSPFGSRGGFPRSPGLDVLEAIAKAVDGTPRQVALAFLARRSFVIPKAAQVAHVEELAHEVTLDDAAIARIETAFPLAPWKGLPSI